MNQPPRSTRISPMEMIPGGLRSHPRLSAASVVFIHRVLLVGLVLVASVASSAASLRFAGFEWKVRGSHGGPGPNAWQESNAFVDDAGRLHLKITCFEGKWSCAEVTLERRLGFGTYDFAVEGPIDRLDDNVVLGLFNYPTGDVGGDETREIDIEFARWGRGKNPIGNYTVWPVERVLRQMSKAFAFDLPEAKSTHRFTWTRDEVRFESWRGWSPSPDGVFASWTFAPDGADRRIAREPMPVHLNLWLFQGRPPKDGREIEIVIRDFRFTPAANEPARPPG